MLAVGVHGQRVREAFGLRQLQPPMATRGERLWFLAYAPASFAWRIGITVGIALFLLHVAGALRHHFLIRDGLIWRMIPGRSTALLIILPIVTDGRIHGATSAGGGDHHAGARRP